MDAAKPDLISIARFLPRVARLAVTLSFRYLPVEDLGRRLVGGGGALSEGEKKGNCM